MELSPMNAKQDSEGKQYSVTSGLLRKRFDQLRLGISDSTDTSCKRKG